MFSVFALRFYITELNHRIQYFEQNLVAVQDVLSCIQLVIIVKYFLFTRFIKFHAVLLQKSNNARQNW